MCVTASQASGRLIRNHHLARPAARQAAKQGDGFAVRAADRDVVNAAARAARYFPGCRGQVLAAAGRAQEIDAAMLGHGQLVAAIAGIGEGRVGQAENEAAVADAVAVEHRVPDRHGQHGLAGAAVQDFDTKVLRGGVAGVERPGNGGGQRG